jgi:hypothetical protein
MPPPPSLAPAVSVSLGAPAGVDVPAATPFTSAAPPTPDSSAETGPLLVDAYEHRPLPGFFQRALAYPFTPRGTPVVLSVAGGLFWLWALGVFLWLFALPRHPRSAPATAGSTTAAEAPIAAAPTVPAAPSTAAMPVAPALSGAPAAPTQAPASAPDTAQAVTPAPSNGSAFHSGAAIRALDGKWRDVAKCRRGKTWGKAATTVTFAGDGSVTHVDVGAPFAGTPTGDCIADTLAKVRVEPFGDSPAELPYRVYVAPR